MRDYSSSPHVYTGRWGSHREWPPGVVPVRISLGLPRFMPAAKDFPAIDDLMPYGLFKLQGEEFRTRFLRRLDGKGVDLIQDQFELLHERFPDRPLMLLCYEDLTAPGMRCHRLAFAEWWFERTGKVILDLQLAELGETDCCVRQPPTGAEISLRIGKPDTPVSPPAPPALF